MSTVYKQTTWGALMDRANDTNDTASKDFLRKCFQGYCKQKALAPFDAETVTKWRNETVEIGIDNMPKMLSEVLEMSENDRWIPVSERLPEDNKPVNITWVNRKPEDYYKNIKDKPFTATGVYYKGDWYWWSVVVEDYLAEHGTYAPDSMNKDIEVIAWQDLPAPYTANQ